MRKNKGITLIALAVTVVVLIILASISIKAITGNESIIKNSKNAKEESEIDSEKEVLSLSSVNAVGKDRYGNITEINLQEALNNNAGENKTKVYDEEENFVVNFLESKRYYTVDKDGNVEGPIEVKEDSTPGVLEGSGTEDDPFVIMSIEDLVYFSKRVNSGNTYKEKYVVLGKTLNFKSKLSYVDYTTTEYDEYLGGDGTVELMTQLSENGIGFKPIGNTASDKTCNFSGIFDGQGYEIKNIYESENLINTIGGLFSNILSATVKNIKISGKYLGDSNYGGIIGQATNSYIYNCGSSIEMSGVRTAGICCVSKQSCFVNCYNTGNISGKWQTGVGGIVGECRESDNYVYNSFNLGDIKLINGNSYAGAGGIIGYGNAETPYIKIDNCYNIGKVVSSRYAGAIVGGSNNDAIIMDNCYYLDNISRSVGSASISGATLLTFEQIQNKEKIESENDYIVNLLNSYVERYNEENKETEGFVELNRWKIDETTGYPIFE